jgi:nitrate/TMAO reductase-like tetraheme cytochrome c subunit
MDPSRDSKKPADGERTRRRVTAVRLLVSLVILNVVVLAAFAVERHSRNDAEFCANCHNMTAHVDSYLESNHMDAAHRRANVGCKDCHADYTLADEMRSVVNFVAGNYDEVFARHKFSDEMCNGCHVGLEYQAARTDHLRRNPHRGHYPDLRCGACHLAHARQIDLCGRCHDNGGQRMTGDPVEERASAPWERMTTPGAGNRGSVDHG